MIVRGTDVKIAPFYKAINKYGSENFTFEIIDKSDDSEKLCELEMYYIEKYRTYVKFKDCNGYNSTLGGDGKAYLNLNENEVIKTHIENEYISGHTAKIFGCDEKTIQKILAKHNVKWLSGEEITRKRFIKEYGGIVQLDFEMTKIINVYDCPIDVYSKFPDYKEKSLSDAYRLHHKTHHYKGFTWYRLNELPEEYKPLLDEYYKKD